jgi:hypothetical protein
MGWDIKKGLPNSYDLIKSSATAPGYILKIALLAAFSNG